MYGFRLMVYDPFIGLWMLEVGCWGVAVGLVRATATICLHHAAMFGVQSTRALNFRYIVCIVCAGLAPAGPAFFTKTLFWGGLGR